MDRAILAAVVAVLAAASALSARAAEKAWQDDFVFSKSDLSPTGSNPYFILQPGYRLRFESKDGDLTITVLDDTKMVDGVETRVVEERETEDGKLIEVSRNYYAISKSNKNVYYFGEDVDNYDSKGKISNHGGTWLAGVNGAKAGLIMPGTVKVGDRYYQEVAPKQAMDRAENVSISESVRVPAGRFTRVLKAEETTPLEPASKEFKYYAHGVGLLKDGDMLLVKHGYVK